MATTRKRKTVAAESIEEVKPQVKKFNKEDLIVCKSIAAGQTFMVGMRSKRLYQFEAENVEREVEYQDLEAAVNSNSSYLFKPFIIVCDDDFVDKFPKLKTLYESMYSPGDLSRILSLPVDEVKRVLPKLPSGAKEAIKNIASGMIADGSLNDIRVIKAIDKEFGTELIKTTDLYD